ncbi:DUF6902 family protein [Aestuariivita boseongensis]|uniref:DUF6902 family protein n=1 Tax=Aestuariivita boseongensis TaxID=1470562 RepID=UPI000681056F|nr:hypothetical protein [Aestuariivita boseongensis]
MSNVIRLNLPVSRQPLTQRLAGLVHCFAEERRFGEDVFWLKENAELLSILDCTGLTPDDSALAPMEGFYAQVLDRMAFFPQYYRFLLSITLDLEDLGLPGNHGEALVNWAADQGLAQAELSDLQRAEARRLMQRRGRDPMAADKGLDDRLRAFINRPETFALPNKKAAYELTHIVFYLSEYGRRDPGLDAPALRALSYAGTLAYLDQNLDLVAEICVALRYAGQEPPVLWEDWVAREATGFRMTEGPRAQVGDNYHEYFVCNWLLAARGDECFQSAPNFCRAQFTRDSWPGPLRALSETLFGLGPLRQADWSVMRHQMFEVLDTRGQDILMEAEANCVDFDHFFSVFARAAYLQAASRQEAMG